MKTKNYVSQLADKASFYVFYAPYIKGYIQAEQWSWHIKQSVADQVLLEIVKEEVGKYEAAIRIAKMEWKKVVEAIPECLDSASLPSPGIFV